MTDLRPRLVAESALTSTQRADLVSATFDLHNLAALRCTSGLGPTSAARTLFDAQEHPLLGKIKALEVV